VGITKPDVGLAVGEADAADVVTDGDGAAGDDAAADVAAAAGVGVWVADAPYPVVVEDAAVMLAIHSPSAKTAPVSKVMMGDLRFMPGSTRKGSRLVQPARP